METTEMVYPIPLSDGYVAALRLPVQLRKADAEKIAKVVLELIDPTIEEITDEDHRVT